MKKDAHLSYIGIVSSRLKQLGDCPKQGREGAPEARVTIFSQYREAMADIRSGSEVILLTWLHEADRSVLKVHPRGNPQNPLTGVFSTRSPNRPNPIGHHRVTVTAADDEGITVAPLEVLDQTPVVDIKICLPEGW